MSELKPKNIYDSGVSSAFSLPEFMTAIPNTETTFIPLSKLRNADEKWNFFRPLGRDKMDELMSSILYNGLIHPIVVSQNIDTYVILSGHNRVRAYKELFDKTKDSKFLTILCQVRTGVSDDEARELIIDSNWVQRTLTPSERTKSIYHKYILIGRKKRSENGTEHKRNYDIIADKYNLSGKQIQRYIKLNELTDNFLSLLDDGKLSLRAGVKIAGFSKELQQYIYDIISDDSVLWNNKDLEKLSSEMNKDEILSLLLGSDEKYVPVTVNIPKNRKDEFMQFVEQFLLK